MEDKRKQLFILISKVYSSNELNNKNVKQGLFQVAQKIENNDSYAEIIVLVYKNLAKLTAKQRLNVNEIKELMEFIKKDYQKLSTKELRKADISYSALFIPNIF